jgi:pilus assembly protein CpaC
MASNASFRAGETMHLTFITRLILRSLTVPVLAVLLLTGACLAPVQANDTVDLTGAQPAGRMLRLGLEKSAVLKLPAVIKDVIVGNPGMVDVVLKNRNTAYLFARTAGQTNIFFLDAAGQQILQLDLEVTLDTKALKSLLDRAMPGNAIQLDSTGANIVLKGMVADAQQGKTAEDLAKQFMANYGGSQSVLNLLKIAEGNQVMLKVRVVELKRSILKRIGIDLEGSITAGPINFNYANFTNPLNLPHTFNGTLSFPGPPFQLDATIHALEDSGLATILAEPTLTATSGAPASFHAGGEYPYQNCDVANQNTDNSYLDCTTLFRNYGISLNFTPTVLTEGRIALNVFTEVSDLAPNPYGTEPLIDTRNAQTSVELPTGGSMMLAGLIKNISTTKMENTPGLRSLPILGGLFSSQEFERRQSELVVIVTPYVVNPTDEKKLATPIDRFNNATDLQTLFLGRLNKVYGLPGHDAPGASSTAVFHGQVGHIVE